LGGGRGVFFLKKGGFKTQFFAKRGFLKRGEKEI
jgi:hypothetical protein